MEVLKEILRIVTSKSDKKNVLPGIDGNESESSTLADKYLQGIGSEKYLAEDDAAKDLYGTTSKDQRYRTLKSRTYDRLMHALLFLQVKQPDHSEYLTYYYKCMRNMIGAQTLMRFASRRAAYAIAQKTLTVSEKYEFTDLCLALSVMLRESAAQWNQRTTFIHHHHDVVKFMDQLRAEHNSDYLLDFIQLEMVVASRKRSYLIDLHKDAMVKVEALRKEYNTHTLRLNSYRAAVNFYDFIEDFEGVIRESEKVISYLKSNKHLSSKARFGEFTLQKLSACLYLRRYEEAYKLADDCISSFTEAGNNWYYASDLAFVAAINMRDYAKAEYYYLTATKHPQYNTLAEATKERWILYGAYLFLAERLGLYTSSQAQTRAFRLSTYINSLPEEAKSKKVYNVLIIISHVFFLILDQDYDSAERRIEYLKVYSSRYLKEKHFRRVRVFLRLIQSFPRHSFLPSEINRSSKELFAELKESANDLMPSETNELIPFEVMYEALLRTVEESNKKLEFA